MEIVRGALVLVEGPDMLATKRRPFLVIQSDLFNEAHASVTLCPVSSLVGGEALFRVPIAPSPELGLSVESEAQVDKIKTLRRTRIIRVLGHAPATIMEQVDQALRRWLAL
ncbi:mRNA interferase MazF [Sphingomonas guangdongensis]|uniref:mRNA interferase MazF n=1 Tax=Sphingomonas guangdongensis TaxID=1141890 RepID=A0A285R0Y5_9SPHN|nr:type II toxin-antitoxin system PemK/MazF family toxin [Sphingomonas guangdongensis]SOB87786.1 mRNA interferase MazF [Sphingomonas guangdongensis]